MIEGESETVVYDTEVVENTSSYDSSVEQCPQIYLHVLTGDTSYQTMRGKGYVGKQVVHMLVDYGSTHNFLDLATAKRLECRIRNICPLQVVVANGSVLTTVYACKGFTWLLQGQTYVSDVMILPLGSCEMVLGIQWLATLGFIIWNFILLVMEFNYLHKKVVLRGTNQTTIKWMQGKRMLKNTLHKKATAELSSMVLCVYPGTLCQLEITNDDPDVQAVLKEFPEVFDVLLFLNHFHQREAMIIGFPLFLILHPWFIQVSNLLGNIQKYVKIIEVGPWDGLQDVKDTVPTSVKVELIKMLVDSGLQVVETTSFVSPKWVPLLADAKVVIEAIKSVGSATFPALTPNLKGTEAAATASESFSRSYINCSIDESLSRYRDVASAARECYIPIHIMCGWMSNGRSCASIQSGICC